MLTDTAAFNKDKRHGRAAPAMQHRHFAFIANVIADLPKDIRLHTARAFADQLQETNRHFNRDRFINACE